MNSEVVMTDRIVIGSRHTGVVVRDMQASMRFYRDILGLETVQEFTDDSEYINTITGIEDGEVHFIKLKAEDGTVLELLEYLSHPTEPTGHPFYNVGVCHIAFRVKDIQYAYNKLKQQGVRVISEPVLSSEKIAKVFFCLDPDNVRVELVEMIE